MEIHLRFLTIYLVFYICFSLTKKIMEEEKNIKALNFTPVFDPLMNPIDYLSSFVKMEKAEGSDDPEHIMNLEYTFVFSTTYDSLSKYPTLLDM